MATAKKTAKDPEDLEVGSALDEVEAKSKAAPVSGAGRPNDNPLQKYKVPNSTFAERAKAFKRVGSALNKAVKSDETEAK